MARDYPATPEGRYFVSKGRLWRRTDPHLSASDRRAAVKEMMRPRRDVSRADTEAAERAARDCVYLAKRQLGERGSVWWNDDAPDESRMAPWNSSYAAWWDPLPNCERAKGNSA